ncbi:MAG: hypothetical protein AAF531_23375 [Actinomycetota bacterium]
MVDDLHNFGAREDLTVADATTQIRRVLRYRVDGDRFTACWLHEENQALIDQASAIPAG